MTEQDCFNALSGRVIQSIEFEDEGEQVVVLTTHDGLTFKMKAYCDGGDMYSSEWIKISQVDNG